MTQTQYCHRHWAIYAHHDIIGGTDDVFVFVFVFIFVSMIGG